MSKVELGTKLDLERIVFIGKTFEEYYAMFSLSEEELHGKKILDCPAGACSFTVISNKSNLDITACDIAYFHSDEDLKNKGLQDIEHAMEHLQKVQSNYEWDYFKDREDLKYNRLRALYDCTNDMKESSERYIPVTLPSLPFKNLYLHIFYLCMQID